MKGRLIVLDHIGAGTRSLTRQFRTWLSAKHLTGRERARTVLARAAGTLVLAWFAGGILYALGLLWWGGVAAWLVSSAAAGRAAQKRTEPAAPTAPAAAPAKRPAPTVRSIERAVLLDALAEITHGRTGVHLWPTVYEGLRAARPHQYGDLDDRHLRQLLALHQVPVKTITAGGIRGRSGIRRADIEAMRAPAPPPTPTPSERKEEAPDQQDSSSSFPAQGTPEGDSCMGQELGDDTLAMLGGAVSSR